MNRPKSPTNIFLKYTLIKLYNIILIIDGYFLCALTAKNYHSVNQHFIDSFSYLVKKYYYN